MIGVNHGFYCAVLALLVGLLVISNCFVACPWSFPTFSKGGPLETSTLFLPLAGEPPPLKRGAALFDLLGGEVGRSGLHIQGKRCSRAAPAPSPPLLGDEDLLSAAQRQQLGADLFGPKIGSLSRALRGRLTAVLMIRVRPSYRMYILLLASL